MEVHRTFRILSEKARDRETKAIEGYVGRMDNGKVRLFSSLSAGSYVDLPSEAILHEEPVPDDTSGKVRVYVTADTQTDVGVQARAAQVDDASGTYCGSSGTWYCWRRIKTADGTYVIIMEPCGSCIPENASAGISEILAAP